jgi:hypothetical protein
MPTHSAPASLIASHAPVFGRPSDDSGKLVQTPVFLDNTTMAEISTKPYLLRAIYE